MADCADRERGHVRRKAPKRIWAVIDPEGAHVEERILWWGATKRKADQVCADANRLPHYESTCFVVSYDLAPPKRSNDT